MGKFIKFIIGLAVMFSLFSTPEIAVEVQAQEASVGICDEITANGSREDRCGEGQITFENASFEAPALAANQYNQFNEDQVPGWFTTAWNNKIEIWTDGFSVAYTKTPCQDGAQCAEINASEQAGLYQDFLVEPGQRVYYSFYHMGRARDIEVLELRIGKPNDGSGNRLNPTTGGNKDIVLSSDGYKSVWTKRYGYYDVPNDFAADGNNTLRIAFLSVTPSSTGNLIDNLEFYTEAVYDNVVSIDLPSGGLMNANEDVFTVNNQLTYFERDTLSQTNSNLTYKISADLDFIDGSLLVEGVSHNDYTYSNNTLVVTNLPEVYEDINIQFDTKLNAEVNAATLTVESKFEYASQLAVNYYPDDFQTYHVTDTNTLNISYYPDGYCNLVTANLSYSDSCAVATNIVYDNDLTVSVNDATAPLSSRVYTATNTLKNLNTDTSFDLSTTTVTYEHSSNITIDPSTIVVNGATHADYTLNTGVGGGQLVLNNLPDVGVEDYVINFSYRYNFSPFTRDVFVDSILLTSKLDYKNGTEDSHAYEKIQLNTSFATNVTLTQNFSDADGNGLLKKGEELSVSLRFQNDSAIPLNNVIINAVTDTTKLQNSIMSVVVKDGSQTLVEGQDYTINGGEIRLNQIGVGRALEITYKLAALNLIASDTPLNNIVSVVADEYTVGKHVLQKMNIDVNKSTELTLTASVEDRNNELVGEQETLYFKLNIDNQSSFSFKDAVISNAINGQYLSGDIKDLEITNTSTGEKISSDLYTYENNTISAVLDVLPGNSFDITFNTKVTKKIPDTGEIINTFVLTGKSKIGDTLEFQSNDAVIDLSAKPTITVDKIVVVNMKEPFNISDHVSAQDAEDGILASTNITYNPQVNVQKPGVYGITVQATDSDNRSSSENFVLVVDDGNFDIGATRILYAKDFKKYISEVSVSDSAIKLDGLVALYDANTGEPIKNETITVNKGTYKDVAGNYSITFTSSADTTASRTINAQVLAGEAPTIVGADFLEIEKGATFDPLDGITVEDDLDTTLMGSLEVTHNVDTSVAGLYEVYYRVEDADRNVTEKKRIILVNDGLYSVGKSFILYAENYDIRVGQVVVKGDAVKRASNATAYSKEDGKPVNVVQSVTLGDYKAVVGNYDLDITITSDPTATRSIVATVKTGTPPTLLFDKFTEIAVGSTFDPAAGVIATDTEDGNITSNIEFVSTVKPKVAGIYTVTYQIEDTDGNKTEEVRVILVNNGKYAYGDKRIIYAENFYKLTTEVDQSSTAVIASAKAKIYDMTTGLELSEAIEVNLNGYSSTIAEYTIEFTSITDSAVSRNITAVVSDGNDPEIEAPDFVEIDINENYNPSQYATASDLEDGDITGNIQITDTVDPTTAGVYNTIYSITDTQGNSVSKKMIVLINDGNYAVGDTSILYATDFSLLVSEVDSSRLGIIQESGLTTYSKVTGLKINNDSVDIVDGGYTNVVDNYDITFTNNTDPKATITVVGQVTSGNPPKIIGDKFTEVALNSEFYELEGIRAEDQENGDISGGLTYEGGVNTGIPGFHTINYSIIDFDGNESTFKRVILVNDGSYVVGNTYIIKATDFSRRVSEVDTGVEAILVDASVRAFSKTGKEYDLDVIKKNITIDSGSYTQAIGIYPITISIVGDAMASIEVVANVVGGKKPTIQLEEFTEVPFGQTINLRDNVTAKDFEDGTITSKIKITGAVNYNVPGIYKVKYSVTDNDLNRVEIERVIIVNDGTYLFVDDYIIRAKDYAVRVGEVSYEDQVIVDNSEFAIFDTFQKQEVNLPYTIDTGNYQQEPGSYEVGFYITHARKIMVKEIIVNVLTGTAPVITTDKYVQLQVGDSYDVLADVIAQDSEDGNISNLIVVESDLDTSTAGVYNIHYTVIDSDFNKTTFLKVVVVDDGGSFDYGGLVILEAHDFVVRVSEVDNSPQGIIDSSQIKVYAKRNGEDVTDRVNLTFTTVYDREVGEYLIIVGVAEDRTIRGKVVATVVAGEIPTIDPIEPMIIERGSDFSLLDGLVVQDFEDGDLIEKVNVNGYFDINKPGVYVVEYSVTDIDENTVTMSRVIIVDDGYYSIQGDYIVHAKDFTVSESSGYLTDRAAIVGAQLEIYNLDGIRIPNEEIIVDLEQYENKLGNYTITFGLINDDQFSTSVQVTVVKADEVRPEDKYIPPNTGR